ncbi:MAG: hypothetical protein HOP29_02880 [Phycisphaerales bacterium]|nr:hypothetical protein [Phycisphaerales bacterium]
MKPNTDASFKGRYRGRTALMFASMAGVVAFTACDAFNPAFLDVLGPSVVAPRGPDSAGHVVIAFRNDATFDERVLDSLVAAGLDEALLTDQTLRPRVRLLLRITFVDQNTLDVEFNDGSSTVIDPLVDPRDFPDLLQTPQNNLVVQCDVARVDLLTLPSVFVPTAFEITRIDPGDENTPPFRVRNQIIPAQFEQLQLDTVDQFGNTVVLRNINTRDAPAPAISPNCGSVVTLTLSGQLSLPFERNFVGVDLPGVLITDLARLAASPGRFRLTVGIR